MLDREYCDRMSPESEDVRITQFREAERRLWDRYDLSPDEGRVSLGDSGRGVRYWEVGSGPPLLFVHGGTAVGSTWVPLIDRIENRRCIVIDRPGCGLSDPVDYHSIDPRHYSVEVIAGILDELDVDSVVIVGNSYGGTIGFFAALDHPDRVSSIVQMGTPLFFLNGSLPIWFRLLSVRGLNRAFLRLQPPSPEQVRSLFEQVGHEKTVADDRIPQEYFDVFYAYERLPRTGLSGALSQIERTTSVRGSRSTLRLTEDLARRIDQRTLFVLGDSDPFGSPPVGRRAVEVMPDARFETVSGGHLPFLDEPELRARHLSEFLDE